MLWYFPRKSNFVMFLVFLAASVPILINYFCVLHEFKLTFQMRYQYLTARQLLPLCFLPCKSCSLTYVDLFPWKCAGIDQIIEHDNKFILKKKQWKSKNNWEPFAFVNSAIDYFNTPLLGKLFCDPNCILCKKFVLLVLSITSNVAITLSNFQ